MRVHVESLHDPRLLFGQLECHPAPSKEVARKDSESIWGEWGGVLIGQASALTFPQRWFPISPEG